MRFYVEWNFEDTRWGRKPMNIKFFANKDDAEAWAINYADAIIGWMC